MMTFDSFSQNIFYPSQDKFQFIMLSAKTFNFDKSKFLSFV